ncbi:MAG: cytochrome C [Rhodocyclaceae bacterium]|nr:cytochrome C [Rhodocyclaceae bacterium]
MKRILLVTALLTTTAAFAGNHAYGPFPAEYVEECASCHVAYPPQLLTAGGWQRVMTQLDKHYGVDASLNAKSRTTIADFLQRTASTRDKHAPTEASGRMTNTTWFIREHWPTPPAKISFADCAACHTVAEKGDYSERSLKLPAGLRRNRDRDRD